MSKNSISASIIADDLKLILKGEDKVITGFSLPDNPKENTLLWTKNQVIYDSIFKGVVVAPISFQDVLKPGVSYLFCEKSPRLIFARIMNKYFSHLLPDMFTNHADQHRKNSKIRIGDGCFIGANVTIGDGTEILHNTSIFPNTTIGKNCHIDCNCSLGTTGLGFEYDGDEMVRFPQIGGVLIGDHVEIGPNTTVRRGSLANTVIGDECKIGSLTNIGHNSKIGNQCILTCQIVIGGSSVIGNRVFMGINSITKNKVAIGDNTTVGMGAIVSKDIPSDVTVVGSPARVVRKKDD